MSFPLRSLYTTCRSHLWGVEFDGVPTQVISFRFEADARSMAATLWSDRPSMLVVRRDTPGGTWYAA